MKTSLILPVYLLNHELMDMTERCLLSMAQDAPDEVIIVNDGSPLPLGRNYFTDLVGARIFHQEENQGYTKAVNLGLKEAKGDILIVANNDLLFSPHWMAGLMKPLAEGYDIATVQVVDTNQKVSDKTGITEGDKFGSLFAITRKVYKRLGGLDEELGRGYFTDLDYQKRAEDAGFRVGKNWSCIVTHEPKSTFKQVDPEDTQYKEAMEKFKKKYGKIW